MSIAVNPPPQQGLPAKLLDDPELAPFFLYQQEYLFKLWLRTGGGTDAVGGQQDQIDIINIKLSFINLRLAALEDSVIDLQGETIVTAVDHTVVNEFTGQHTVICTAELTVTLTLAPNDRDTVEVKQRGFKLLINGNGRDIDGSNQLTIRKRNTALQTSMVMRYSLELDEWFVI